MNNIFNGPGAAKGALLATAVLAAVATGCAEARERSATRHTVRHRAVAPAGTNQPGWLAGLLGRGPQVYTDYEETWSDTSAGGGTFVLTDPAASAVHFGHTNQTALGGSRGTDIGQIQTVITTNAVNAITAGGAAAGNVIGAAVKAAAQ